MHRGRGGKRREAGGRVDEVNMDNDVTTMSDDDWKYVKWAAQQSDAKLHHLTGYLWYPAEVSWRRKQRTPRKNEPVFAVVGNHDSGKAYIASEETVELMRKQKLEWVTNTWKTKEDAVKWVSEFLEFVDRECTVEDLGDGPQMVGD